ncbi:unnamed protein product [Amoebophrya sp. A120]|nr:unnamed protein product [Amoebophrya sp. A120]|eukprot:GSA120T00026214001.1
MSKQFSSSTLDTWLRRVPSADTDSWRAAERRVPENGGVFLKNEATLQCIDNAINELHQHQTR